MDRFLETPLRTLLEQVPEPLCDWLALTWSSENACVSPASGTERDGSKSDRRPRWRIRKPVGNDKAFSSWEGSFMSNISCGALKFGLYLAQGKL